MSNAKNFKVWRNWEVPQLLLDEFQNIFTKKPEQLAEWHIMIVDLEDLPFIPAAVDRSPPREVTVLTAIPPTEENEQKFSLVSYIIRTQAGYSTDFVIVSKEEMADAFRALYGIEVKAEDIVTSIRIIGG